MKDVTDLYSTFRSIHQNLALKPDFIPLTYQETFDFYETIPFEAYAQLGPLKSTLVYEQVTVDPDTVDLPPESVYPKPPVVDVLTYLLSVSHRSSTRF